MCFVVCKTVFHAKCLRDCPRELYTEENIENCHPSKVCVSESVLPFPVGDRLAGIRRAVEPPRAMEVSLADFPPNTELPENAGRTDSETQTNTAVSSTFPTGKCITTSTLCRTTCLLDSSLYTRGFYTFWISENHNKYYFSF